MKKERIKTAYDFFKNDNDVFKNSNLDKKILSSTDMILDTVWKEYVSRGWQQEDKRQNPDIILTDKFDLLNSDKYTYNVDDAWYIGLNEFLMPYISKHLIDTGWKSIESESEFLEKDNRKVDMFEYMESFTHNDTDIREWVYEYFVKAIDTASRNS